MPVDGLDCGLLDGYRMTAELLEKGLRELGSLEKVPAAGLFFGKKRLVYNELLDERRTPPLLNLKCQSAAANPFCLFTHILNRLAARRNSHTAKPASQALAQFDFARVGPQGLTLEIKHDQ